MELRTDVEAVLFDWVGTLVLFEELPPEAGVECMLRSLRSDGYPWRLEPFQAVYQRTAKRFWEALRPDREIPNSVWVAAALEEMGVSLSPEDPVVVRATGAYFQPYLDRLRMIPGARETLSALRTRFRLGLVSNFTHADAVYEGLRRLGIGDCFDAVAVSGAVGLRKPHPGLFEHALRGLRVERPYRALFVGDDISADVVGAATLGLQPILMAYTLEGDYEGRLAQALASLDHGVQPPAVPIIHQLGELIPALLG